MSSLKFSLAEMQETLRVANAQTNLYSEAITTLDTTINQLSSSWITSEIGTYEEFLNRYNEKRQQLFDARDYMIQFCNKLNEQINRFDETANEIKSSFV